MKYKQMRLGDIADVVGGGTPSTKHADFWNGDIPWLTPKDLSGYNMRYISKGERNISQKGLENSSARMLPKNTILLTSRAPIGYLAIANNDVCTNQGFKSIVLQDGFCPLFFYYLLKHNMEYIVSMGSGSTFAEISGTQVKNLMFNVPELQVQKQIATVLSVIDDKIELNAQINNNLEQQAQALLQDYYAGCDSKCSLGKILSFVNGFAFKSSEYISGGQYKIITIKNVKDGQVDSAGADSINDLPNKLAPECALNIGDVLLSLTGNVGRVGIVCEDRLLLNQRVSKVCPRNEQLKAAIYFILRDPKFKTEMENISRGTAQQNLSPVETLKLEIPIKEGRLAALSVVFQSMFNKIVFNTMENARLASLRDALLPKLMRGEIDVSNIDISTDKLSFSGDKE